MRNGYQTIEQVAATPDRDLLQVPKMGRQSVAELRAAISISPAAGQMPDRAVTLDVDQVRELRLLLGILARWADEPRRPGSCPPRPRPPRRGRRGARGGRGALTTTDRRPLWTLCRAGRDRPRPPDAVRARSALVARRAVGYGEAVGAQVVEHLTVAERRGSGGDLGWGTWSLSSRDTSPAAAAGRARWRPPTGAARPHGPGHVEGRAQVAHQRTRGRRPAPNNQGQRLAPLNLRLRGCRPAWSRRPRRSGTL
jgi:hypothetical protein